MPLTKNQKADALDAIQEMLEGHSTIYLTNYSGLTVAQANDLRRRFREADVEFQVLKNTLVRIAMERLGGYEEFLSSLSGPTAVAFSEDPATPARIIKKFLSDKNLQLPEVKAAYIDGAVYGEGNLDVLSKLKSKQEMIGDIIGLLLSPAANLVGALNAPGSTLVGALQTIAEREEAE